MRIQGFLLLSGGVLAGALALSCGGGSGGGSSSSISPEAKAEAQTIFDTRCATCHGKGGLGDGPGAVALNPKPRNYTDKTWQATVNDDYLKKVIVQGGGAVGLSPLMAPNPDLKDKPEVVLGLVQIVRSFGK